MNAAEAADVITEGAEEQAHEAKERFRSRAALVIAVLAALLAVCELGGDNSKDAMIQNNIQASDTWAFYQAKSQRQTAFRLAADELKRSLQSAGLNADVRAAARDDLARYEKTVARYEDEPDPRQPDDPARGEGKKQLQARAKAFEAARDLASEKNDLFDYAQMALQLAIVLGSVAILAVSRQMLWTSGALGALGLLLVIDGFTLILPLPG